MIPTDAVEFGAHWRNGQDRLIIRNAGLNVMRTSLGYLWEECLSEDLHDGVLVIAPSEVDLNAKGSRIPAWMRLITGLGPGQLVGELGALRVNMRSVTVTAPDNTFYMNEMADQSWRGQPRAMSEETADVRVRVASPAIRRPMTGTGGLPVVLAWYAAPKRSAPEFHEGKPTRALRSEYLDRLTRGSHDELVIVQYGSSSALIGLLQSQLQGIKNVSTVAVAVVRKLLLTAETFRGLIFLNDGS